MLTPFTAPAGQDEPMLGADHFRCAECHAVRLAPPAASDDYSYDDGAWREAGNPVCGPCARRGSEYPQYIRDGSDDEAARCCGGCDTRVAFCTCRVTTDDESGETGCLEHHSRA